MESKDIPIPLLIVLILMSVGTGVIIGRAIGLNNEHKEVTKPVINDIHDGNSWYLSSILNRIDRVERDRIGSAMDQLNLLHQDEDKIRSLENRIKYLELVELDRADKETKR